MSTNAGPREHQLLTGSLLQWARVPLRISVGLYLILAALFGLDGVVRSVAWPLSGKFAVASLGFVLCFCAAMALSGILLLKGASWALRPVGAVLLLQAPMVQIGRFAYAVSVAPILELKVVPRFGVAFSSAGTFLVWRSSEPGPFYLGMNLVPIFLVALLCATGWTRRSAREA